jgi:methylated-DNA-[protein]-cysteine S-methyltransferase
MTKEEIVYTYLDSFIGKLLIAQKDSEVKTIWFMEGTKAKAPESGWRHEKNLKTEAVRQLRAYFDGELQEFDLTLFMDGTPFQKEVWKALQQIPYGETVTYGDIAKWIGRPKAVRAVGGANGKNHIPIVIPCHRVIGSSGQLTGFGSGLPIKIALLEHELKHSGKSGAKTWRD